MMSQEDGLTKQTTFCVFGNGDCDGAMGARAHDKVGPAVNVEDDLFISKTMGRTCRSAKTVLRTEMVMPLTTSKGLGLQTLPSLLAHHPFTRQQALPVLRSVKGLEKATKAESLDFEGDRSDDAIVGRG